TLRGGNPQVTDWTYTEDGTTITLTGYTGSSTDVVIPTAQDLGFDESYTAQISKEVLQSVANNKTSLSTSTNGKKIVVSSTDLNECLKNKSSLTTMNLSNLDVSNVTNMSSVFYGCWNLTSLDVSNWDTSNVTNMSNMFSGCSGLTTLDLSSWNCDKVTNNGSMFKTSASTPLLVKTTDTMLKNYNYASDNRTKLGKVKIAAENGKFEGDVQELALFDYTTDKDLTEASITSQLEIRKEQLILAGDWMKFKEWTPAATYTTFVEKAGGTYTASVPNGDWKLTYDSTDNVVTLTQYVGGNKNVVIPTAKDCGYEGATAKISKEVLQQAASKATSLTTSSDGDKIVVSSTDLNECFKNKSSLTTMDLSNLDTSNVTNMSNMFRNCYNLTSLDVSNWDTSNVTNMSEMFTSCNSLTSLDVSNWDTSNVTNMSYMFNYCPKLTSLDVSHFDTSNVTNMSKMFGSCRGLTSLDVTHFDTNNVTNMSYMFSSCRGLTSLDVSHWDTSNVTNMSNMFDNCHSLTSLDVSHWDTSNVTNMVAMLSYCTSLTSLDVSHWDTSNVTNMGSMFNSCSKLTSLDVSHFDTSNVTNMSEMFNYCPKLTSLDVSHFDTSNVTNMSYMFYDCSGLTTLDLSSWNCDEVTNNRSMFRTSDSTPLLVKTTNTKLKNYNYASDNRTKLGKVKIAAENGKFEGDVQELALFDYTTDKDLTEAGVTSQLTTRKKALIPNEGYMFKEWTPEATYTTFAEKAGGTYTAEVKQADWEWTYNSTDNVVTLTKYIGESKDVVIPTAKDCGHEGATAKISKEVLQQAVGAV
ncbi:BspA family leucine-rich repeat surface protein, partial [Enterococcus faecium]|nr:BspA family leucine-rich repeat surface protein [Enterococcus faecium]